MRKIKTMLLVVVAALAMMSLAAPAASAGEWMEEGAPLEESAGLQFSGEFEWPYGGIGCQVDGEATLSPGGGGEITAFDFVTCKASGGLSHCQFTGSPSSLPWSIQANHDKIVLEEIAWKWSSSNCIPKDRTFTGKNLTLTPNNIEAISTLNLSGSVTGESGGGTYSTSVNGAFEVSPAGSYGLAPKPTAYTDAATNVAGHSAKLNATVNPKGSPTSYYFQYWKDLFGSTKVPVSPKSIGSGNTGVAVSESISGLMSGTTYYYMVVAINGGETINGGVETFTTDAGPFPAIWGNEGVPLEENASVEVAGSLDWDWSSGGYSAGFDCEVEGEVTLETPEPGNQGEANLQVSSCVGSGAYAGIQYSSGSGSASLEANDDRILASDVFWEGSNGSTKVSFDADQLTLTPDNREAISLLYPSGSAVGNTPLGKLSGTVSGYLEVQFPNAGVYGLIPS